MIKVTIYTLNDLEFTDRIEPKESAIRDLLRGVKEDGGYTASSKEGVFFIPNSNISFVRFFWVKDNDDT
jgi:hypothetical protein